ncbi:MAG TPA: A24 family peptidase [Candidatus Janibacter merdipullorum]|nr:A24 family peptidase [Candidatus Janibacter merdipullorum]
MDTRTLVVILAMTALGCAAVAWLRTGAYRREDEGGPLPGHWWVAPVAPVVGVLLARSLADAPWPVLLPYLALVPTGLALAAIDADVHRLPNAITLPLVPVVLVLLAGASAATGDAEALRRAGWAALLVGGGFLALAFLLYGRSIGMGDAKLVVSLAPALGWLSWSHVLLGLWLGFVIGGLVALGLLLTRRATKGTHLAFGPSLVAGVLLAVVLSS